MKKPYINPYSVLGLAPTATAAEIKQAYFKQVREYPPERDPENFKRIRAAYERLRNPEQRSEADMRLLQKWPAPARKHRTPEFDFTLHPEDVLLATRALTDLARKEWREYYRKVKL